SSIAIVPWYIYMFYGDCRLLEYTYDNIKNYVGHIANKYPDGLTSWGLGDWSPMKSKANVELTSTVYYYVVTSILANAAELFERHDDNMKYSELAEKIKNAFNDKFLDEDTGIYGSGYQTELSMPLFWGLVPDGMKTKVAKNLAKRVEENDFYLDVGQLGSKALLNALSANGYADIAWKVASQETFPSWGWWIVNGATTFFENWRNWDRIKGSKNHINYGEISAWFYKSLGGINPDREKPGFKNVILKPHFASGLDHFEAVHNGPYGPIKSSWKRNGSIVIYKVTIPPNSTASLYLTGSYTVQKGRPLSYEDAREDSTAGSLIRLSAGSYVFIIE
ncbi:alpha-L-rhamnosidase C-terminal domain-containing protein, partial [Bacteroidota bacterium]